MLEWCDQHGVFYIVGIGSNARLRKALAPTLQTATEAFESTQEKQRHFMAFSYAARTWKRNRRIIGKAEVTEEGPNPRFIVTNLQGEAQHLYDTVYCARGEMENRIKEVKLALFAERTSCHKWWPNQLRLLLSSLAYILIERLRALALQASELVTAQAHTIRIKIFKIGTIIVRNTRRICFLLSSYYPCKALFCQVADKLAPD
jgi:hypothetical protein